MANLVINTFCNLRCPYCFAEDEKATYVNEEMSEENFKKAVDWIVKSEGRVGIIGGEPTWHSHFGEYIMYLINNPKVEVIMLYTNGSNMEKYKTMLSNYKVRILVNINHPDVVGGIENLEKVLNSVEEIRRLKKENGINEEQITLGINLYKPNQDYTYFIEALKRINARQCRMSVSIENVVSTSEYNPLDYFRKMKDTMLGFLRELIKIECVTQEDCNFIPKCVISEDELSMINAELHRVAYKHGISFDYAGICQHSCLDNGAPLDIHPDMKVSKCFGCSEYDKQNLFDYNSCKEIGAYFNKSISNYSSLIPLSPECSKDCKHYNSCNAGCMKYKLEKISSLKKLIGNRM